MAIFAMIAVALLVSAVSFLVSELIRPKPDIENARPADSGDFRVTTATEGRKVPLIWGTVLMDGPNIVWWGNITSIPIRKKIKTGMFSKKKVVTGFLYFASFQFALCRGVIAGIKKIRYGKKLIIYDSTLTTADIVFDDPNAQGGQGTGGNGGLGVRFVVHDGAQVATDPHLLAVLGATKLPTYEGTAYVVGKHSSISSNRGAYMGNSPSFKMFDFTLARFPDNLSLAPGHNIVNLIDANPMEVIYEILTDDTWGLGLETTDINLGNFQTAAEVLFTEGNGFSFRLDTGSEPLEIIREVERQIAGKIYVDLFTGEFNVKLIRNDYTLGALDLYDESNITTVKSFARTAWSGTANEVRVPFDDATRDYKSTFALAQDGANFEIQGERKITTVRFPGVKSRQLAADLAWRELRELSYPLAQISLVCNRTGFNLKPADVIRFSWVEFSIVDMPLRVTRVDFGTLQDGKITIEAVQDIFQAEISAFTPAPDTEFTTPVQEITPFTASDQFISELPLLFAKQAEGGDNLIWHAMVAAADAGGEPFQFEMLFGTNPTPSYSSLGVNTDGIAAVVTLRAALGGFTTSMPAQGAGTINVDPRAGEDASALAVGVLPPDEINSYLLGVAVIDPGTADEEYIIYQEVVVDAGGLQFRGVIRGALDTVPKAHLINAPVWFAGEGGFEILPREFAAADDISVKLLGGSPTDAVTEPEQTVDLDIVFPAANGYRAGRPYPPNELQINSVVRPSTADADTDISEGSEPTTPGLSFVWTRRDRNSDNVLENALGLDDDGKDNWGNDQGANEDLRWNVWLYDLETTPSPTGRGQAILALSSEVGDLVTGIRITREQITDAATGGIVPNSMRIEIESEHDLPATDNVAFEVLEYDFSVTSDLQTADALGDVAYDDLEPDGAGDIDVSGLSGNVTINLHRPLDPHGGGHAGPDFEVDLDASVSEVTALVAAVNQRPGKTDTVSVTGVDRLRIRHHHGEGEKLRVQILDGSSNIIAAGKLAPEATAGGSEGEPVASAHDFGWVEYEQASVLKDILLGAAPPANAWTVPKDYTNLEISVPNLGIVTDLGLQSTTAGLEEGIYIRIDRVGGGWQVFKLRLTNTLTSITLPDVDAVFNGLTIDELMEGDKLSLAANVTRVTATQLSRPLTLYCVDNDASEVVAIATLAPGVDAEYSSFTTHGADIPANVGTTGPPTTGAHGTSIGSTGLRVDQRLVCRIPTLISGAGRELWLYVNSQWIEVTGLPQAVVDVVERSSQQVALRVWHNWDDAMPGTIVDLSIHDWDIDPDGNSDRSKIFEVPLERD